MKLYPPFDWKNTKTVYHRVTDEQTCSADPLNKKITFYALDLSGETFRGQAAYNTVFLMQNAEYWALRPETWTDYKGAQRTTMTPTKVTKNGTEYLDEKAKK